jgi:hypothetical protein
MKKDELKKIEITIAEIIPMVILVVVIAWLIIKR